MSDSYYIPANFTDAGKIFGAFEIRNAIEAVVLVLPVVFLCVQFLPFMITTNIIIMIVLIIPLGGFAVVGINDDCMTRFIRTWRHWKKRRGIITFKGAKQIRKWGGRV